MDPMLGMVFMVPWNWAPADYVRCNGQQMSIQQYAAVYSLLGTVYGGNGSTNFNVPNLQCRMPMGYGQSTLTGAPGVLNVGQLGGAFVSTLNQANIPLHIHTSTFTAGGAGGTSTITGTATLPTSTVIPSLAVNGSITQNSMTTTTIGGTAVPSPTANVLGRGSATNNAYYPTAQANVAGPAASFTLSTDATTIAGSASGPVTLTATGGTGGGTVTVGPNVGGAGIPFGTVSPYLALNFIIAINGNYPMRN